MHGLGYKSPGEDTKRYVKKMGGSERGLHESNLTSEVSKMDVVPRKQQGGSLYIVLRKKRS